MLRADSDAGDVPAQQDSSPKLISIVIEFEASGEKMKFKNRPYETNVMGNLLLQPLLEAIKRDGIALSKQIVSYYSAQEAMFVFVGPDPVPTQSEIQMTELLPDK